MNMTNAQTSLLDEIIVDNFAGGGGASTGIELATGRPVTIAINHDPDAIRMHEANHPYTEHYQASVWDIDPPAVCGCRPVGLAWFSPDCKHFSKAKGGKPVDKNIRGLAWITLRWAGTVRPRVIILENVEEFQTWGPVRRGKPLEPCFAALGFASRPASADEVSKHYRAMSKVLHPDKSGDPAAFVLLNDNYRKCLELMEESGT